MHRKEHFRSFSNNEGYSNYDFQSIATKNKGLRINYLDTLQMNRQTDFWELNNWTFLVSINNNRKKERISYYLDDFKCFGSINKQTQ